MPQKKFETRLVAGLVDQSQVAELQTLATCSYPTVNKGADRVVDQVGVLYVDGRMSLDPRQVATLKNKANDRVAFNQSGELPGILPELRLEFERIEPEKEARGEENQDNNSYSGSDDEPPGASGTASLSLVAGFHGNLTVQR